MRNLSNYSESHLAACVMSVTSMLLYSSVLVPRLSRFYAHLFDLSQRVKLSAAASGSPSIMQADTQTMLRVAVAPVNSSFI